MQAGLRMSVYTPKRRLVAMPAALQGWARNDPASLPRVIGKALKEGRYDALMTLDGRPGFLPGHLLRFDDPVYAVDHGTGFAWQGSRRGGIAAGSIFDVFGLASAAETLMTATGVARVALSLPDPVVRRQMAELAEMRPGARSEIRGTSLVASLSRQDVVEMLLALVDELCRKDAREADESPDAAPGL